MDWLKSISIKAALAVILVLLAFTMVVMWMFRPPSGDTNSVAILAGFVTLFLKMAADACSYFTQSSASSDKKTEMLAQAQPIPPEAKTTTGANQ